MMMNKMMHSIALEKVNNVLECAYFGAIFGSELQLFVCFPFNGFCYVCKLLRNFFKSLYFKFVKNLSGSNYVVMV